MAGHVFACQADLTKLACDAWLLPTNSDRQVLSAWTKDCPTLADIAKGDLSAYDFPEDWGTSRAARPKTWDGKAPMPILTITGSPRDEETEWFMAGIEAFVEAYAKDPVKHLWRAKPLLGIPLVGTGKGGGPRELASVLKQVLPTCQKLADAHNLDIAITLRDPRAYAVCQFLRRKPEAWPDLDKERLELASDLASKARQGELVLFLGAGVSMGAGLPSWGKLLSNLADAAGMSEDEKKGLENFDYLDRAQILKTRLKTKGIDINREIALQTTSRTYALAQALLADWHVTEAITQNYDDMYEQASRDAHTQTAVVPYEMAVGAERWLLKQHGCIHHPEDIVLTRQDYLEYSAGREALSGVVQTLMMTRHMVILGFSLTDEHFIELTFDLSRAVEGMARDDAMGTVIMLHPDPMRTQLWEGELRFASAGPEGMSTGDAARQLEILIDCVGAWGHRSWTFLFDEALESFLTPEELKLRDGLKALVETVGEADPMTRDFVSMLKRRYGY